VHTVVAEHGEALLGFYRLTGEAPVAELADLFVDPMAIGRGVGATLLADAVDPNAAGFYVRMGAFYVRMGARRMGSVASGSVVGRELPRFGLVVDPGGG